MNKLIAFAGRKRSGKGLLSEAIVNYHNNKNVIILTVAFYLKDLCCDLLSIDYNTLLKWKDDKSKTFSIKPYDRWYKLINNKTNIPIETIQNEIGNIEFTNVRQLLQVLGTDLIRKYRPNWHVDCLVKDIQDYIETKTVIIDDVRFPNERQAIEKLGGEVFFIIRPNFFDVSNHISEISLKWQEFDDNHIIINDFKKENMIVYMQMAYANNFVNVLNNPIFLASCNHFKLTANPNFPNRDSELVKDIIKKCKMNVRFMENGLIHYSAPSRKMRETFNREVLQNECDNWQRDFIIYNPLINENLKFFM